MDNEAEAQLKRETHLNIQKEDPNDDNIVIFDGIASVVKTNSKVLSSDEYCSIAERVAVGSHISNHFQR
jgi:hypothetical protein